MKQLFALILLGLLSSCSDYLNVVPDNVATIDNAFTDESQAEKYLFTCYSYLPEADHQESNPGFHAGDENWIFWPVAERAYSIETYKIARGLQNKVSPLLNYWDGGSLSKPLWEGIRACNIFIDKIEQVSGLQPYIKSRWIAEVKFLKAYYHWYLLRMYGPIPIVDVNLPISASTDEVRVKRESVDDVVNYIVDLIDEVTQGDNSGLPNQIDNLETELGRITKPAALSIKARILVTAASPLFNGNSDYSSFNNVDGTPFFNATENVEKWEAAVLACREAIEACEVSGIKLYEFTDNITDYNDAEITEMSIRNAVTEEWNDELIWGYTGADAPSIPLQKHACPNLDPNITSLTLTAHMAPTMRMAELFYTENGVPINEDKTWDYGGRFELQTTSIDDSSYLMNNYQTVGLHFDREPRFYADMAFDGSKWLMENNTWNIQNKLGEFAGKRQSILYSITGYYAKKLVNWNLIIYSGGGVSGRSYAWPIMRLGDLYLLYAEALNETGNSGTSLEFLNRIRTRAGLESVESSWTNYSNNPTKYSSKEGLREIIHQERLIEMAFEGSRFWDLRRWKKANTVLSQPIYGWDIVQSDFANYNRKVLLFNQQFISPRDYFWPIGDDNIIVNSNLVQNPGW